ncbi:AMP-binding protein [Sphingobium xenophagum]
MQPAQISFSRKLRLLAEKQPSRPAVTCGDESITYAELDARSNCIARSLQARGVLPGALVTLALPNSIGFVEAAWGIWKAGATPQPVSFRLPKGELKQIAELAETPIIIGDLPYDAGYPQVSASTLLSESLDASPLPPTDIPILKAPTSGGSTGRPKLIISTARAVVEADARSIGVWGIMREDTAFIPTPLYHNAGFMMMYAAIGIGAHLVLAKRFDAQDSLQIMERLRISWVYLVPTMMHRIWRLPTEMRTAYDLSSLRAIWHLAAPCPAWLKETFIEWLGPDVINELYSGTEAQARAYISGREWLERRGSVGRVLMGEMKIFDEAGQELAPDEVGEIYMRTGPQAAASYTYRGATARTLPGGWESLGDMGRFDEDGYLYLADRRTDMILVGGSNVYPAEVEAILESHPLVQSCAVIGLPDDDLGNRVHAIVQLRSAASEEELREFMRSRIVTYKHPRSFEFVDFALRDDAGKVRRGALREDRLKL